jgi:hypothetical protein
MKAHLLIGCWMIGAAVAGEPVALFNGKDLSGWTFDLAGEGADPAKVWRVEDGVVICAGKPAGVMRTEKEYGDYELVFEWRWAPGKEPGNSGCLIHASTPRALGPWPKSIEVQLMSGNAGDFFMIGEEITGRGDAPEGRRWKNFTDGSEKPVGEWNTGKVRAEGDTVTVWVNGEKVNHGTKASATKGAICFQSEGAEIHFRKIELTPLAKP